MILDKVFPPDPRVENEAISLINAGHEVFLFCLSYDGAAKNEYINEIQVKRYKSNKLEYKLSALAYTVPFYTNLMAKKIANFLDANAIEALHIHDIRIADAALKANIKLQLPVILDLHDNMPEIMKLYPHLQKFPGRYLISPRKWKIKEEELIHKATKVITVSKEFKNEVVNRTQLEDSKIKVVPNTVRRSFYEDYKIEQSIIEKYKDNFVILYLGDTGLRRGLQTAINALPILIEKIPKVKLVIVGKNSTDEILINEVKEKKLASYVDFEGWQNVSLFPTYILASSVCISPLHRNIQHDVAYANKLFQYMSFAKPILVSNATAQMNLVNKVKSGLVHEERNATDFTQKILELFENESLSLNLGANGKAFIENEFCWEKTSKALVELYNNLKI